MKRHNIIKTDDHLGFELYPRRSRRYPAKYLTTLCYADDCVLFSNSIENMQALLHHVELASRRVGLSLNRPKTQYMLVGQWTQGKDSSLNLRCGAINMVDDYKYLGSFVSSTVKDFETRRALAFVALNKMKNIWKSSISRSMKIRCFQACIEPIYLYGCESWIPNLSLMKRVDGGYTRLLRSALGLTWKSMTRKEVLYGDLPPVSTKVNQKRLQLAGHLHRMRKYNFQPVCDLILWQPSAPLLRGKGRKRTLLKSLLEDSGANNVEELSSIMDDVHQWNATFS